MAAGWRDNSASAAVARPSSVVAGTPPLQGNATRAGAARTASSTQCRSAAVACGMLSESLALLCHLVYVTGTRSCTAWPPQGYAIKEDGRPTRAALKASLAKVADTLKLEAQTSW